MWGKLLGIVTLVAIAVLALMAMDDGDDDNPEDSTAPSTSPAPADTRGTPASPSPSQESSDPPEPPGRDEVAQRRKDAALAAARAFARPGASTSRHEWWKNVEGMLAEEFAREAAYVDPQQVGYTRVGDGASIVDSDDDVPARVRTIVKIDTDAGAYGVNVADGPDGPKVTAIYAWADR